MLDCHMRSMHHNRCDIVGAEWCLALQVSDGIERRVVAANAGIELQRNTHGFPRTAEFPRQLVEIEAVVRARKCRTKAAIGRFKNVDDPGETGLGEQRAVKATLSSASSMHSLDHRD